MFLSKLIKIAITFVDATDFTEIWYLVICVQSDVSLLVQNLVKIQGCLPQL